MSTESEKLFFEAMADAMKENLLKEAGSMSTDVATFGPLIFPLIKKIYPESLVSQIASVQPTKSPVAKVAAIYSEYTGNDSNNDNNIHLDNSRIISITSSAASAFTVGNQYVTNTGVSATVFYIENASQYLSTIVASSGMITARSFPDKYAHLLVRVDSVMTPSGTVNGQYVYTEPLSAGTTINGKTILYTSVNRNTIKRVFKDYSDILEANTNLREVNMEVKTIMVETKSRKIRSKFTQEKLQDLKALYNEKAYDLCAESVANEIRQEIDREAIKYIKDIATPMPADILLSKSFGASDSGSLADMTYDLYFSVFMMVEEIVRATKRNRTMFVLADSTTAAFLTLNPLHAAAKPEQSNPYRVGNIGPYPLYSDPYSTEHYVIVGYRYDSTTSVDDAGLIFVPYTNTIIETTDGNAPFTQNFMTLNRYAMVRHPQDVGTGIADSDFFRYVAVDFAPGTFDLRNLSSEIRTWI